MDTCETMLVTYRGSKGTEKHPIRVNVSDFDEKSMIKYDPDAAEEKKMQQDQTPQIAGNVQLPVNPEFPPQIAPSAPLIGNPVAPETPSPNQRFVTTKSGKGAKSAKPFIVVDGQGEAVPIDGIDPEGYATEGEAWTAIMALPR